MRPLILRVEKALSSGLRSTERQDRNQPVLVRCLNLRPSAEGLAAYEPIEPAVTRAAMLAAGAAVGPWPFPQYFRGRGISLLACETQVFSHDEQTGELSLLADGFTAGKSWQFADFQNCWLLSNGETLVYQRADITDVQVVAVQLNAIHAHQGRLYVSWDDLWQFSDWQDTIEGVTSSTPVDGTLSTPLNNVLWTNVGSLALFWWLLDMTTAVPGDLATHDADHPLWREMLLRGDWGFAPMTYAGRTLTLASSGGSVIAYGVDGISRMTPMVEPVPSHSITPVSSVGLWSRGSVAALLYTHLYMDASRSLWTLPVQNAPTRVDYSEQCGEFDTEVIGCADAEQGLLYLSDGELCLVLTETGMMQTGECPSSLAHFNGALRGTVQQGPAATQHAELIVNLQDFNIRGLKMVDEVRIAGNLPDGAYATVEYRDSPLSDWDRDVAQPLNTEGCAVIGNTALEHRIVVGCDDWRDMSIDFIEVQIWPQEQRFSSSRAQQTVSA